MVYFNTPKNADNTNIQQNSSPNAPQDNASLDRARGWYVQDFLDHISIEKNLAKRTVIEYEADLNIFFEYFKPFLDEGLTLQTIDHRTIREFLAYLRRERDYTAQGLNRKIACLKSYFMFLEQEKILQASPMRAVSSAKGGKLLPKVLDQGDVDTILAYAQSRINQPDATWNYVRDWAILELFYATGMRLAELVGLDLSSLSLEERRIKVTGKGNKQRFVFINEAGLGALCAYLKIRPKTKSQAVFLNRFFDRLSRRAVEIMFEKVKQEAGIFKEASPHTLRHSFATHMLEGGADLVTIRELMGHSSLSTTQVYTNISRQHMREVYDNSHPRK